MAYDDGKLYLNAGMPEVRELVADGVREIVSKYDVDGIVFDDYSIPIPYTATTESLHSSTTRRNTKNTARTLTM